MEAKRRALEAITDRPTETELHGEQQEGFWLPEALRAGSELPVVDQRFEVGSDQKSTQSDDKAPHRDTYRRKLLRSYWLRR